MDIQQVQELWERICSPSLNDDLRINDILQPRSITTKDRTTAIIQDETPYKYDAIIHGNGRVEFYQMPF